MPKKKTKEEYIEQLRIKNPKLELLGDYIDDHTKTSHRCNIHDIVWDIDPCHALRGHGCKECALEGQRTKRKKSEDQYIKELSVKNPNVKLRGHYINTNTPVEHYCEIHDVLFDIRPNDALQGKGCRMCKSDKLKTYHIKSEEQYIEELDIKNPNLKLAGHYLGGEVPVSHCCKKHNVVWDISPNNALRGDGCCQCRSEKIRSVFLKPIESYIEELSIKNPCVRLIGEYINCNTPTEHYCTKHNNYFTISPECALRGHGCNECTSEKIKESRTKSEEQYIMELKEVQPNIVLKGKYVGCHVNTLHECLICGCEWSPRPSNLLSEYGCPCCIGSKGEKQVKTWLKQNKIIYIAQKKFDDCIDKRQLPFDFYLPNYNTCIEYQGKQHYEPIDYFGGEDTFLYIQYHDMIKRDYCYNKNFRLICIPYFENVNEYLNKNLLI